MRSPSVSNGQRIASDPADKRPEHSHHLWRSRRIASPAALGPAAPSGLRRKFKSGVSPRALYEYR